MYQSNKEKPGESGRAGIHWSELNSCTAAVIDDNI
jgi:hypothetical protein